MGINDEDDIDGLIANYHKIIGELLDQLSVAKENGEKERVEYLKAKISMNEKELTYLCSKKANDYCRSKKRIANIINRFCLGACLIILPVIVYNVASDKFAEDNELASSQSSYSEKTTNASIEIYTEEDGESSDSDVHMELQNPAVELTPAVDEYLRFSVCRLKEARKLDTFVANHNLAEESSLEEFKIEYSNWLDYEKNLDYTVPSECMDLEGMILQSINVYSKYFEVIQNVESANYADEVQAVCSEIQIESNVHSDVAKKWEVTLQYYGLFE